MPELARLDDIRKKRPLLHCISNTVTANDCANLALALGASPMMAEAPEEAAEPISFWNRLCLERTLALCRKQGTQLVLYTAPNAATWTQGRHLAMEALARELGISYLDANGENLDINWNIDTLDRGEHLNYRGAAKVTAWLGAYLQTQGLEDRRDSAAYASWQEDLEVFQAMLDDPENYY